MARAEETKEQVAREVVEVREQAAAVAAALEASARQAAELVTAEGERADAAALAEAQAQAAAAIAEAEAKSASVRVAAAEAADDANAALARAEVRRESAAVQADALRLTARREATMHRRQQLDETHQVANGRLDSASDLVVRLGVALEDLSTALSDLSPRTAEVRAGLEASDTSDAPGDDTATPPEAAKRAGTNGSGSDVPHAPIGAAERLRRVRHR